MAGWGGDRAPILLPTLAGWTPDRPAEADATEAHNRQGWWAVVALDTAMTVHWVSALELDFIKAVGFEVLALTASRQLALQKLGMLSLTRNVGVTSALDIHGVYALGLALNITLQHSLAMLKIAPITVSQAFNLAPVLGLTKIQLVDVPAAITATPALAITPIKMLTLQQVITAGRGLDLGLFQSVALDRTITATGAVAFGFPPTAEVTDAYTGTSNQNGANFTHTIRRWCDWMDLVVLGAGGSGQASAAAFNYGAPGNPGSWATYTFRRGPTTDGGIPQLAWSEVSLTGTTGTGGDAIPGPSAIPGASGSNTTLTVPGLGTLTGNGGGGGVGWAGSNNYGPGPSPNTLTFNGKSYVGGANNTTRAAGKPAGGAGSGSGGFSSSYAGARGGAWVRSYQ